MILPRVLWLVRRAPNHGARSGFTPGAFLLVTSALVLPVALGWVGKDTLDVSGGDAFTEMLGFGALGLAAVIASLGLVVLRRYSRVELTWDAHGITCRGRGGVTIVATWSELRDEVDAVHFAHARFARPSLGLRRWAGVRRLVLRRDDRSIEVLELFFPDFERVLALLGRQRARIHHW